MIKRTIKVGNKEILSEEMHGNIESPIRFNRSTEYVKELGIQVSDKDEIVELLEPIIL